MPTFFGVLLTGSGALADALADAGVDALADAGAGVAETGALIL